MKIVRIAALVVVVVQRENMAIIDVMIELRGQVPCIKRRF